MLTNQEKGSPDQHYSKVLQCSVANSLASASIPVVGAAFFRYYDESFRFIVDSQPSDRVDVRQDHHFQPFTTIVLRAYQLLHDIYDVQQWMSNSSKSV